MDLSEARKQLLEIKKTFDYLEVPFWLSGGTLLGAVREGDVLAWDHDADIAMLYKDYYKGFENHFTGFNAYPISYFLNKTNLFDLKKPSTAPYFRVNVFLLVKNPRKGVYMKIAPPLVNCAKTIWAIEDVETPTYVSFLGEKFRVPRNPENILASHYGKDWRTLIKRGESWKDDWEKLSRGDYFQGLEL